MSLQEISSWIDKDSSSGAHILIDALNQSNFIICLLCLEKLLAFSLPLSKMLQSKNIDLASAINIVEDVESSVQNLRENADAEFQKIFEEAKQKAEICDIGIKIPRLANKQMHRINVPTDNCVEYYQISIFLPWLHSFLSNLKERFSKHKTILTNLMVLLTSGNSTTQKQIDDFHALVSFCHQDVAELGRNVLEVELRLRYQKFMKIDGSSVEPPATPKCAIDALIACNAAIYTNIFTLLKIFATIPVSTATAERTISTLRRLKSYLRNTMSEKRLNGLANLNIHR
nr:unnamed protein product [Callosobruchus analis]